jgi:hypothetical protein
MEKKGVVTELTKKLRRKHGNWQIAQRRRCVVWVIEIEDERGSIGEKKEAE